MHSIKKQLANVSVAARMKTLPRDAADAVVRWQEEIMWAQRDEMISLCRAAVIEQLEKPLAQRRKWAKLTLSGGKDET